MKFINDRRLYTQNNVSDVAYYAASSGQLAMLLELSAYPKPGNVHRTQNFDDMRFEHFLGTISGLYPIFIKAVTIGFQKKHRDRIGKLIFSAVQKMLDWQTNGNTSLGTILLLIPLLIATGKIFKDKGIDDVKSNLKYAVEKVCQSTSYKDSIWFYKALKLIKPGGLGKVKNLDVNDNSSIKQIRTDKIPLHKIFSLSASYDSISAEWGKGFPISFNLGYPCFSKSFKRYHDVNMATLQTFLTILSKKPDSLIQRKVGLQTALDISQSASEILRKDGLTSLTVKQDLENLDSVLRTNSHQLNPGTTADLTCSSIYLAILEGFRP